MSDVENITRRPLNSSFSYVIPSEDQHDVAHTSNIYSLCTSSSFAVTGSYDHTVRVWSKLDRTLALKPLTGHRSSVLAVKVSEELNLICSGDGNGQIILWSLYTGVLLGEVDAHSASVLSISLDKRDLVSTSKDRTVKLWQILGDGLEQTALRHQYTLEGHEWPILASKIYGHRVITTSKDSVRIWSIEDGSCLEVIQTFSSICEFDMVPGCEGLQAMCACTDGQVRIYDLADGKEVACLQGHAGVVRDVKVLTCPLMPGYMIISAGYDGTLRVWATEPKKEQWQCIHILSFSDRLVTWFGEETEATEVKGEDIKPRAKRVFSMWLDGTTAYVVGEGAEIVVFNLGGLEAIRYFLEQ